MYNIITAIYRFILLQFSNRERYFSVVTTTANTHINTLLSILFSFAHKFNLTSSWQQIWQRLL